MSDKYGECYCGDCISFNKCKSDKGTRINLVSEGCSCFEPLEDCKADYPILNENVDEESIRADERRKFIAFMMEHTHCRSECENILNCDGKKCWNNYLEKYEKEQKNDKRRNNAINIPEY